MAGFLTALVRVLVGQPTAQLSGGNQPRFAVLDRYEPSGLDCVAEGRRVAGCLLGSLLGGKEVGHVICWRP